METCLIYMTAANIEEAGRIGKTLVEERLVACVNIFEGMQSMYWWEGKIVNDHEVTIIAKTRSTLVSTLTERVKALHSYTVPCVVSVPITSGNQNFLDWIIKETAAS